MKTRLHITLLCCVLCCLLICSMLQSSYILPIYAEDASAPTLQFTQIDTCEPGQDVTLSLSLPVAEIAGGFFTLQYDASLFSLKSVTLLQQTDLLTLTSRDKGGSLNVLLDAAQNVHIEGALLTFTFTSSEEAQPGTYPITCTVPDTASFFVLQEDGSPLPLQIDSCSAGMTLSAPVLPTCPARYLACQETNPAGDTFLVRICALVEPETSLFRGSYGFVCTVTDQNGTRELTLGGSELTDSITGGDKTYTAEAFGGSFYTATLTVPATGEVTVTLTPYVREDAQALYAGTYTGRYKDGVYLETLQ